MFFIIFATDNHKTLYYDEPFQTLFSGPNQAIFAGCNGLRNDNCYLLYTNAEE